MYTSRPIYPKIVTGDFCPIQFNNNPIFQFSLTGSSIYPTFLLQFDLNLFLRHLEFDYVFFLISVAFTASKRAVTIPNPEDKA